MKIGYETMVSHWPDWILEKGDFADLEALLPPDQKGLLGTPSQVRRIQGPDGAETMAEAIARKALDTAGLKPADIDCIVAENCGGKYVLPGVGGHIHRSLGCPAETIVFDVRQGGASFVESSILAWALVESGRYHRVLVVMVAAASLGGLDPTSPIAMSLSDGAAAAVVSAQNLKCEFLASGTRTDSFIYDHIFLTMRPAEHPELLAPGQPSMGLYLTATPEFFECQARMAKDYVRDVVGRALKKAGLGYADLDTVIAHQASSVLLQMWMDGMEEVGVGRDRWKESWERFGGALNVDIGANLVEVWEAGGLAQGKIIALFGPGAGGHTSSLLLKGLC